jgi:hypothetical protein
VLEKAAKDKHKEKELKEPKESLAEKNPPTEKDAKMEKNREKMRALVAEAQQPKYIPFSELSEPALTALSVSSLEVVDGF